MPLYSFVCPKCGNKEERVRAMKNADKKCMCTECGTKTNRDFTADIPFASGGDYKKPIHSDSLAINPSQRAEHEQRFPNIKLDKQCRPVFSSFSAHQKYLNDCNLVKDRKKIKPHGKRIA